MSTVRAWAVCVIAGPLLALAAACGAATPALHMSYDTQLDQSPTPKPWFAAFVQASLCRSGR